MIQESQGHFFYINISYGIYLKIIYISTTIILQSRLLINSIYLYFSY